MKRRSPSSESRLRSIRRWAFAGTFGAVLLLVLSGAGLVLRQVGGECRAFADARRAALEDRIRLALKGLELEEDAALADLTKVPAESAKLYMLFVIAALDHPKAVELVLEGTRSKEPDMRRGGGLRSCYDPRALSALVDLLKDPNDAVRKVARASADAIRYYFEQRRFAREAGSDAGALGAILEMPKDPEPAVRLSAIRSPVKLKAREALPALVPLRKNPDAAVRKAAEEALDVLAAQAK
jgi:hypothetical protein